jgi:hypothetical protein
LSDAEFRVFSQWGEDGILEWLIQRVPLCTPRFIEFGVENYREANTRFLLENRNWKGLVIDGSAEHIDSVRRQEFYWRHDLTAVCAFIDRDNIKDLIINNGFSGAIGILSVDIDGNDYWVWQAINCVNPELVICEYNAVFGDIVPVTIPYKPDFQRTAAHPSNLYWGASIRAFEVLAERKGYDLIGTNMAGTNAFFIRHDLLPKVSDSITSKAPLPSFIRESRDGEGKLNFKSGLERLREIRKMPVLNLDTGVTAPLEQAGDLYSEGWSRRMGAIPKPGLA